MFVCHPIFSMINIKQKNNEFIVTAWKSKGIFDDAFVVQPNSHATKIVNAYIVYDLNDWQWQ